MCNHYHSQFWNFQFLKQKLCSLHLLLPLLMFPPISSISICCLFSFEQNSIAWSFLIEFLHGVFSMQDVLVLFFFNGWIIFHQYTLRILSFSVLVHLDCFCSLAITNGVSINIFVQDCVNFFSFGCTLRMEFLAYTVTVGLVI